MAMDIRPENMERITTPALAQAFIDEQIAALRAQIGGKKVLLALSGGVDSSVVAALLIKAVGRQLVCVHVNHGLLRKGEPEQVIEVFRNQMNANLIYVDATDRFLDKLAGVSEPEKKRKIIGGEFIEVCGAIFQFQFGIGNTGQVKHLIRRKANQRLFRICVKVLWYFFDWYGKIVEIVNVFAACKISLSFVFPELFLNIFL